VVVVLLMFGSEMNSPQSFGMTFVGRAFGTRLREDLIDFSSKSCLQPPFIYQPISQISIFLKNSGLAVRLSRHFHIL
jgi:hypothetical protein